MESAKSKVNMHFENIAIEVDYVGHDLFQEVFPRPRRRTLGRRHLHATPNAGVRYFNLAYPPTGLFKYDQAQTPTPQKTR
jgi:hypothetical protein